MLKAGTMTGTEADFSDSMAAAMESAFLKEWPAVMGSAPSPAGRKYWRLLFASIAQGVVRYLKDHADDAFRIHSVEAQQENSLIRSSGTISIYNFNINFEVIQNAPTLTIPNRVMTENGEGKLEILTDDNNLHPYP